jgi:DNA-directed RNA polymerase specialized sigma24 family protein
LPIGVTSSPLRPRPCAAFSWRGPAEKAGSNGGGRRERLSLDGQEPAIAVPVEAIDLLAVHAALDRFEAVAPRKAQLVKLPYFAGFTLPDAADILGISRSTAEADWTYSKAWLKQEMEKP